MNAHQQFVANLITRLTPQAVAELVACPPSGRSRAHSITDVHALVTTHGTQETKAMWAVRLADAVNAKAPVEWPATWALPIMDLIFDLPVPPVDGVVVEMERAA